MIKNYVFVDLDASLVHCVFRGSHATMAKRNKAISLFSKKEKQLSKTLILADAADDGVTELYSSYLRDGALDLLKALRDEFGSSNVRMLTAAMQDYAIANSEAHGLGFTKDQILHRGTIDSGDLSEFIPDSARRGEVALIDDLPDYDNGSKLRLLRPLLSPSAKHVAYIRVQPFYGPEFDEPYTAENVRKIIALIKQNVSDWI